MKRITEKLRLMLVSPTNSMVVRRRSLSQATRDIALSELKKLRPREFGLHIDYLCGFAGTPRYSYNSGLLALAAWLREHHSKTVDVHYLDLFGEAVLGRQRVLCYPEHEYPDRDLLVVHGLTPGGFLTHLAKLRPNVVGVNCFTSAHHCDVIRACEIAKRWAARAGQNVATVVGGVHPSALDTYFVNQPSVDYVVRGEGELTFSELLLALRAETSLEAIDGLTYCPGPNRSPVRTDNREAMDVRSLPWIARDLVPKKRGKNTLHLYDLWHQGPEGRRFDVIVRSRGCPYVSTKHCLNCASARVFAPFRERTVADCLDEVEHLADEGVEVISDESDQVLYLPSTFRKFCHGLIERGLNKRVDFITPNGLHIGLLHSLGERGMELMIEAGYRDLCLSLEGSQEYLNAVLRKEINVADAVPVCTALRHVSQRLHKPVVLRAFVMIDGPGATTTMVEATHDLCRRLVDARLIDQVIPFIATPIAGSAFFAEAIARYAEKIQCDFNSIYLPRLLPEGALDDRRAEILSRIDDGDMEVLYEIFHEYRVWPAFRYGLGRVQSMFDMESEYLEIMAERIHKLSGLSWFRIG